MASDWSLGLDALANIQITAGLQRALEHEVREQNEMTRSRTPWLNSLPQAYDKLIHNVEEDAKKAHERIAGTDKRRPDVMAKVGEGIGVIDSGLDHIGSVFDTLVGDNGGPLENSDNSQTSSAGPSTENPQKP